MNRHASERYAGARLVNGEQLIPLTLDQYMRAEEVVCRCEAICECTDEQIMAAHAMLTARD
jgi:hypothetical protein